MSQEKHEWQFRDQVVPARLFFLGKSGDLSFKDLLLLMVIHSLIKPQGTRSDEAGAGCWASNAYLAKATDSHEKHVARRVGELRDMGLLLVIHLGKQRYLETEWARTSEEREALIGDYGAECRREYSRLLRRLSRGECKVSPVLPMSSARVTCESSARVTCESSAGVTQLIRKKTESDTKNTPRQSAGGVRCNRFFPDETSCPAYLLAQKFYHACRQKQVLSPSHLPENGRTEEEVILAWRDQLQRWLRRSKVSVDKVTRCLDAYTPRLGERFLPNVFCMSSFCKKFDALWGALFTTPRLNGHASNGHTANGHHARNGHAPIALTPEAKKLAAALNKLHWSKDAGNDFAAIAQQSITNHQNFRERLVKILTDKKHKLSHFAAHVRSMYFCDADSVSYLTRWFEKVCESYQDWEAWSGVVRPFAEDCKQLKSLGYQMAREYSGRRETWDELLAAMREVTP